MSMIWLSGKLIDLVKYTKKSDYLGNSKFYIVLFGFGFYIPT